MPGNEVAFRAGHLTLEVSAIGAEDSAPQDRWLRVSISSTNEQTAMTVALDPTQARALWDAVGIEMGLHTEEVNDGA